MTQKKTVAEVKRTILGYLQDNSLKLRKKVPGLVDAQYEDGKLVLSVTKPLAEVPVIEHKGITFEIEVDVVEELTADEVPASEKAKKILSHYPSIANGIEVEDHKMSEAISSANTQRKDQKAYAAWKARHKAVKVK
jgi:hypothetical protein